MTPDQRPPAGGFGESPGAGFGPQPLTHPVRSDTSRMWTVVAVAAFLAIGGMVYLAGMSEYRTAQKLPRIRAENNVSRIGTAAANAFAKNGELCPSAAPVPGHIELVAGGHYQPTDRDWVDDPGWKCLSFQEGATMFHQLRYERTDGGFVVTAEGDIDGNGIHSVFQLEGQIVRSPEWPRGQLVLKHPIVETNPGE